MNRILGGMLAAVSAMLLTACTADVHHSPPSADAAKPVSLAERRLLHRAEEDLIHRCMTDHGWPYEKLSFPERAHEERVFPYLVDDDAWATEYGYGDQFMTAEEHQLEQRRREGDNVLSRLTSQQKAAWSRTLLGRGRQISVKLPGGGRLATSDKGCVAEARTVLYRDMPRWFAARRTVDALEPLLQQRVREERDFKMVMTKWTRCVNSAGHAVDGPAGLREELARSTTGMNTRTALQVEIRTAKTEATCARRYVSPTIRRLEEVHRPRILTKYRTSLTTLNEMEHRAISRAEAELD
ncbi:hypothetical protein [Streptomyces sp. SYSU K217416]